MRPASGAFCVIGMGKLGAQELNLSSDIDLIYVFDGSNENSRAVARLGETLTELLSAQCFRVDLRLRPGGRNAPLVTTFDGALSFYQSFGETWERAALLRARPVAGALEVGQRLTRRARALRLSPLSRLRHPAPVARDEASDRTRAARPRISCNATSS